MTLRVNTVFLHRRVLTEDRKGPARCRVTRIFRGNVYYRVAPDEGEAGGVSYFPLAEAKKWAKPECGVCLGSGAIRTVSSPLTGALDDDPHIQVACRNCDGTGRVL